MSPTTTTSKPPATDLTLHRTTDLIDADAARAGAARALEFDEALVDAHALAGFLKFRFDWNWTGGEIAFKRALELSSGHAPSHHCRRGSRAQGSARVRPGSARTLVAE